MDLIQKNVMKISNKILCAVLATCLSAACVSRASDTPAANPFLTTLSAAPRAELPAKAADLVAQAGGGKQRQAAIDAVQAAVGLNPAAAPAIVGSIAQGTPEVAGIAAGTAASLVPNQAVVIARAAAAAAPKQAGKIVEAICRVLPGQYQEVANAVAEVVPDAAKEILGGVSTAIPTLKAPISKVLAASGGGVPSVSAVLKQVSSMVLTAATVSQPAAALSAQPLDVNPVVKPPYVPPVSSPVNIDPGTGGQVPTGGHGYSAP